MIVEPDARRLEFCDSILSSTKYAFSAVMLGILDHAMDVASVLGKQFSMNSKVLNASMVSNVLNAKEALKSKKAVKAAVKEYLMLRDGALLDPVEVHSVEDNVVIAKGKSFIAQKQKHTEDTGVSESGGMDEAVAVKALNGQLLFD